MIFVVAETKIVTPKIGQIDHVVDFDGWRMRDPFRCISQSLSWPGQELWAKADGMPGLLAG
jgi:hypothetical protein